ncbi:hypothetical protein TYRP_014186 [Tyrophagus putrescentiae]|nr:hypothetical protein TYRP_014186 [Tyrophagus putrescentiae]
MSLLTASNSEEGGEGDDELHFDCLFVIRHHKWWSPAVKGQPSYIDSGSEAKNMILHLNLGFLQVLDEKLGEGLHFLKVESLQDVQVGSLQLYG